MTQRGEATRARLIEATRLGRPRGRLRPRLDAGDRGGGRRGGGDDLPPLPGQGVAVLRAVLESNAPVVAWVTTLPARAGEGTVEENLTDAAVRLAGLRDQILPLELAIAADPELAAQRRQAMAAAGTSLPPGPPEAVAAYLAAEQRLGRVRADVDPQEAASVLLGMLFALGTMPSIGDESLQPRPCCVRGPDAHPGHRAAAGRLNPPGPAGQALASFPSRPRPIVP